MLGAIELLSARLHFDRKSREAARRMMPYMSTQDMEPDRLMDDHDHTGEHPTHSGATPGDPVSVRHPLPDSARDKAPMTAPERAPSREMSDGDHPASKDRPRSGTLAAAGNAAAGLNAPPRDRGMEHGPMTSPTPVPLAGLPSDLSEAQALAAFEARDRTMDGRFVVAVKSTGIYCKPSCPARRPRRENILLMADAQAARAAGYRPCRRCRPDDMARDHAAIDRALALIAQSEASVPLAELARAAGYAPHHFQRLFTRAVGISPAAYGRQLRAGRLTRSLDGADRITDAIYDAGYAAPSRAYADARTHLGMSPSAWRDGGAGARIRFALAPSTLGLLLVAATDKGLCRISFDEDEAALRARFPKAEIVAGDAAFAELVRQVVALVDDPGRVRNLPVDVAGTAFQQAVWAALRAIPAGETRSYAQIAAAIGKPGAARAVGSACASNNLALLIPCHRVLRGDGAPGGYAWGVPRKQALLRREAAETPPGD